MTYYCETYKSLDAEGHAIGENSEYETTASSSDEAVAYFMMVHGANLLVVYDDGFNAVFKR